MKQQYLDKLRELIVTERATNPAITIWGLVDKARKAYEVFDVLDPIQVYNRVYHQLRKLAEKTEQDKEDITVTTTTTTSEASGTVTITTQSPPFWRVVDTADLPDYQPPVSTKDQVVGIIADTHEPFTHPGYRDFCKAVFDKYKVDRIVHIGDEVDNYALSYHEKNPDHLAPSTEAEKAQEAMNKWYRDFPTVDVLVGNHSALPHRKATTAGLPKRFLKTYEEIWKAPAGWKWHVELEIDNVKYVHGIGSSGQTGAIDRAIRSRQSTVIGHIHAFAGVNYHASNNDLIFGMNVGCGIDTNTYAFEYGKEFVNKPVLGCGIVINGTQALFVPMNLGSKYTWK